MQVSICARSMPMFYRLLRRTARRAVAAQTSAQSRRAPAVICSGGQLVAGDSEHRADRRKGEPSKAREDALHAAAEGQCATTRATKERGRFGDAHQAH